MADLFKPEEYKFYKPKGFKVILELNIETPYEGKVHIKVGDHGGEDFFYVEFIEFDDNPTPEEIEEIETYIENNLYTILENAEQI